MLGFESIKHKLSKTLLLLMACLLLASCLVACGEPQDLNLDQLKDQLKSQLTFTEELAPVSDKKIAAIYDFDEDDLIDFWCERGAGATAEEIIILEANDSSTAKQLKDKLEDHRASQIKTYENYVPTEVPKLQKAPLLRQGKYLVFVVNQDSDKVKEIVQAWFKG